MGIVRTMLGMLGEAARVTFRPTGTISATNVQDAIEEVAAEAPQAAFVTIDTPSGTDVVADGVADTLTLAVDGAYLVITGTAASDTITFEIDINGATDKAAPVGADEILIADSEASNAIKKTDLTTAVNNAGAVMEADYNANTILIADTDDTPTAKTIGEDEVVARAAGGAAGGMAIDEQEVLGRLTGGALGGVTIGIVDDNLLQVDGSPNSTEYARFTAAGLEGRTEAEFKADFNLEIGTDVQAWDAGLDDIAGLTPTANTAIRGDGTNWVAAAAQATAVWETGTSTTHSLVSPADVNAAIQALSPTVSSAFSAHKNGTDQTGVADSTFTQVTFSTEVYDVGSNFATSAWTPPSGKVHMDLAVVMTGTIASGNQVQAAIYKNGVIWRSGRAPTETNVGGSRVSADDDANGTDVYTAYVQVAGVTGTATVSGAAINTYFSGHMI